MSTTETTVDSMFDVKSKGVSTLRLARRFGVAFVLATIGFGAVSFMVLLGLTPVEPTDTIIVAILAINALLVLLMAGLVAREIRALLLARRRGRAAARMHIRIVGLFGIVAAFPAILVAIIAGITLDLGLDRIFDNRSRTIMENSISVARSYVAQTVGALNTDTVNMGLFLNRNLPLYRVDPTGFRNLVTAQARIRGLVGASIVAQDGSIILESQVPSQGQVPEAGADMLELAADGRPACIQPRTQNLAMCVVKLTSFGRPAYVYAVSAMDPDVLNSIQLMRELTAEYVQLEQGRLSLQLAFAFLYIGICLVILLAAIWMGIAVADRLVEPIRRLITAADAVAAGNLGVQVPASRTEGELRSLTDTFNQMTDELRTQRDEILNSQEQIDSRRRFTEAVLAGVTAGVVGVAQDGRLTIANSSAVELLGGKEKALLGRTLDEVSPELAEVVKTAQEGRRSVLREQITMLRGGSERTLNVQVAVDVSPENENSHVVTIDDITDLVTAQRTSAWADVAQRIAHEIKNPLTPIQLSAERIKRRYGKKIGEDRAVFDQCTETIIRQVGDIGRMVDEFSSFARMPKPIMLVADLRDVLREAVFLQRVGHPEITFDLQLADEPMVARFDERLLTQAFGNLVKNAVEAMEDMDFGDEKPEVTVRMRSEGDKHIVEVIDNGKGLPAENRQRLLEPYMTTREKGTGLGLAIVGKILEEHHGEIQLTDAPAVAEGGRGAMVRVVIPAAKPDTMTDNDTDEQPEPALETEEN